LKINFGNKATENNLYFALLEMAKKCQTEEDMIEIKTFSEYFPVDDLRVKYILALSYSSTQKIDNAIIQLEDILAKSDTFNVAYVMMGQIYGRYLNDMEKAEFYLQKAIEKKPKNSLAFENLGIVYGMKQDYRKSLEYLKKALEFNPENEAAILNNLGITYRMLGDEQKAQEYFSKAQKFQQK
jgi:tetratricopeptide (TPR) repeat protein